MCVPTYCAARAPIVEGGTERAFYSVLIEHCAATHGLDVGRAEDGDGTNLVAARQDGSKVLVKLNNVGTVTQMANSAEWFLRSCATRHHDIP